MIKIFLFFSMMTSIAAFSQQEATEWKLFHPLKKTWLDAGTYGSVQEVLVNSGELPDPFIAENEALFQWIEKYDWEFQTNFIITESQTNQEFIEIEFPGIDTYAFVYLNGKMIFKAENAFHPYRFQIKNLVQVGENNLRVVFTSPVNYHREAYKSRGTKLPAPNDVGEIGVSSMSRKAQYQFGWDWAPRINTIGFLKPFKIHAYSQNRILLAKVDTKSFDDKQANLQLALQFAVQQNRKVNIKSNLWGELKDVEMKNGQIEIPIELENPKIWWPRGHGEQHIYTDYWIVSADSGKFLDSVSVKFGIKTSKVVQEEDQWGTSFSFEINGIAIFCKGANYIPQDVFPSRITDESIRDMVEQMHVSNFNMVRVWGGGFYQDDVFYDACDQAGIMVWQDLMFACAMYPGDERFLKNVQDELNYQIPRISAHPSVVLFNGNNEVEVAWKYWGFQLKYMIGPQTQKEMEQDYNRLFKGLAPELVQSWTSIPYMHTSPLSHWGKDEFYRHGTQHYWGVWHGNDPIEDFGVKSGRFNAEYGFQSFPEYSTLLKFSTKKDWSLASSVMKNHQKSYVGNGMIQKQSDRLYGKSKNFEDFVYLSQLTQSKAVSIAISSHRLDYPRCMGTLYWQMNDCWPAPSWSSIDYYGNWKALQYQVKDDYEDVAVLAKTETIGNDYYFLKSDQPQNFETVLKYEIFDLKGKMLLSKSENIFIQGNWQQDICLECRTSEFMQLNYVIQFSWKNAAGADLSRSFSHLPNVRKSALREDVKIVVEDINELTKTAVLKIENSAFLADFWIFSSELGVRFDHNFIQLLPGEHRIQISFDALPKLRDFDFKFR
jgi:beta-mannosidase